MKFGEILQKTLKKTFIFNKQVVSHAPFTKDYKFIETLNRHIKFVTAEKSSSFSSQNFISDDFLKLKLIYHKFNADINTVKSRILNPQFSETLDNSNLKSFPSVGQTMHFYSQLLESVVQFFPWIAKNRDSTLKKEKKSSHTARNTNV